MKVQVFEPFAGWHHTKYVALLLPTLIRLQKEGRLSHVVVTTTQSHYNSDYFADSLAKFTPDVHFDIMPFEHGNMPGIEVSRLLRQSLRRNQPDYLISTSANNGLLPLSIASLIDPGFSRRALTSVGVIHNGYVGAAQGFQSRIRDVVQRAGRRLAPWSEMHVVNPLLFSKIKSERRSRHGKTRLLPDPVAAPMPMSSTEARTHLEIPVNGRYIGQIGKSDGRKAIPELLAAFRAANLTETDRLLIAGNVHEPYKRMIEEQYGDLTRDQRIIVLDRYLSETDLNAAYFAVDIGAVAYYTEELSGNMLAAIATGRPVIASDRGYTRMIIDNFDVGWTIDVMNHAHFTDRLRQAYQQCDTYTLSAKTRRLLEFHHPQNFVDTLLLPLYERLHLPTAQIKTWDWVLDGEHGGAKT